VFAPRATRCFRSGERARAAGVRPRGARRCARREARQDAPAAPVRASVPRSARPCSCTWRTLVCRARDEPRPPPRRRVHGGGVPHPQLRAARRLGHGAAAHVADTARYAGLVLAATGSLARAICRWAAASPSWPRRRPGRGRLPDQRPRDARLPAVPEGVGSGVPRGVAQLGGAARGQRLRAWVEGAVLAGGARPRTCRRARPLLGPRATGGQPADYAFLWLINPVLLVIVARSATRCGTTSGLTPRCAGRGARRRRGSVGGHGPDERLRHRVRRGDVRSDHASQCVRARRMADERTSRRHAPVAPWRWARGHTGSGAAAARPGPADAVPRGSPHRRPDRARAGRVTPDSAVGARPGGPPDAGRRQRDAAFLHCAADDARNRRTVASRPYDSPPAA
jgi:hypothetical protein